jgi:prepilin-type N-terminal cleavage/methylation domain-containing protein
VAKFVAAEIELQQNKGLKPFEPLALTLLDTLPTKPSEIPGASTVNQGGDPNMLTKVRNRQKGFTLIELLIVVAIIGIIAALLIPNFLDALQKAKQKRTVTDERNVGTAMFSWLTDQVGAAAAGAAVTQIDLSDYNGDVNDATGVADLLVDQYIQTVPTTDGWKKDFYFNMKTGTQVLEKNVLLITSGGRSGDAPTSGNITVAPFDPTDYDQDIIWADGFFVRWPGKTGT